MRDDDPEEEQGPADLRVRIIDDRHRFTVSEIIALKKVADTDTTTELKRMAETSRFVRWLWVIAIGAFALFGFDKITAFFKEHLK